jgi:uncharacterized protein (DUF1697 family)
MRNENLRGVFEQLGFSAVRTVISSGNVLFEADAADAGALEARIEQALPERLGFGSTTIIRSRDELRALVDADPFAGVEVGPQTVLNVTFLRHPPLLDVEYPHTPQGKGYTLLAVHDRALCSVVHGSGAGTSDLMTWLQRRLGSEMTTRTYRTVGRILARMA